MNKMLKNFNLENVNQVKTPMVIRQSERGSKEKVSEETEFYKDEIPYRNVLVVCYIYLCL